MDKHLKVILTTLICALLIANIFCVTHCSRIYSKYNENYRDTIYVDRKGVKTIYMNGMPSGIVQSRDYNENTKNYFIMLRRLSDSRLDSLTIGYDDYKQLSRGDTILGNAFDVVHDTIYDTMTVHIENKNGKAKAYVLKGAPSGVIVEGHHDIYAKTGVIVARSCTITVRSLNDSKLYDIPVGRYDYERFYNGDTIYGR